MHPALPRLAISVLLCVGATVAANEPQSLSATVDGSPFRGDDDTIVLVPLPSGAFSLSAASAGAASYPPPKTPVDRLAITCRGFVPGQPMKLGTAEFANSSCDATFSKGASSAGQASDDYALDKNHPGTRFEVTAAQGKVIRGQFELHLKNSAGKALVVSAGQFVAEDRQL